MAELEEKLYSILMTEILAQKTFDGDKTQTRRVIGFKDDPIVDLFDDENIALGVARFDTKKFHNRLFKSRYGKAGSHLAVKENFTAYGKWEAAGLTKTGQTTYRFIYLKKEVAYGNQPIEGAVFGAGQKDMVGWFRRPSLFMPRWACRSIVEITDLRVERVQDISETDARQEQGLFLHRQPQRLFKKLWDDINKERGFGWDENPWVLAITYKKI